MNPTTSGRTAWGDSGAASSLPQSFNDMLSGTWTAYNANSVTFPSGGNTLSVLYQFVAGSGGGGGGGGGGGAVIPPTSGLSNSTSTTVASVPTSPC